MAVDRLDGRRGIWVGRADHRGQDVDLAEVGQGVQDRQGPGVVAVGVHVGVEDQGQGDAIGVVGVGPGARADHQRQDDHRDHG
jgi:hypothetical protein